MIFLGDELEGKSVTRVMLQARVIGKFQEQIRVNLAPRLRELTMT